MTRRALKLPDPTSSPAPGSPAIVPISSSDLFSHLLLARFFPLLPYSVLNVSFLSFPSIAFSRRVEKLIVSLFAGYLRSPPTTTQPVLYYSIDWFLPFQLCNSFNRKPCCTRRFRSVYTSRRQDLVERSRTQTSRRHFDLGSTSSFQRTTQKDFEQRWIN